MSDYESHKGKLIPTEYTKEELVYKMVEEAKENSWEARYKNQDLDEDTIQELFWDIDDYVEIYGKIYFVEDTLYDPDDDIYDMEENEDGTLSYNLRYYNGGCGFSEALDTAADRMKNETKSN